MRVFAISDLHTDFEANWQDLLSCSRSLYADDLLIVAGDISDRMEVIRKTLLHLQSIFKIVFYTPGNHELWAKRQATTSPSKLAKILNFCRDHGIFTAPRRLRETWIVPLFSWYQTEKLAAVIEKDETLLLWADLYFCVWNEISGCVSDYMADLNSHHLEQIVGENVISFSHFLPLPELLPDIKRLKFKPLEFVSVCPQIHQQIQLIRSRIHIFGHTHINCDISIDGVRYIQNAFGYPREKSRFHENIFKYVTEIL